MQIFSGVCIKAFNTYILQNCSKYDLHIKKIPFYKPSNFKSYQLKTVICAHIFRSHPFNFLTMSEIPPKGRVLQFKKYVNTLKFDKPCIKFSRLFFCVFGQISTIPSSINYARCKKSVSGQVMTAKSFLLATAKYIFFILREKV